MLSETERASVQKAIDFLNRALDSLLAQHRSGFIDIQKSVVDVTEALEQLEEMLWPSQDGALQEWTAALDRIAKIRSWIPVFVTGPSLSHLLGCVSYTQVGTRA